MHRFYIPPENWEPEKWDPEAIILSGSEAHHARHVLRLKPGNKLVVFNGQGRESTAEIIHLGRDQIRLHQLGETHAPPPRCRITLGQAIPKGKNMDLIVQKAVELGAADIAPIISDRSVVSFDSRQAAQKRNKWQQVAIEAAKQCGQNWLPWVHLPRKFADFFSDAGLPTLSDGQQNPKDARTDPVALQQLRLIGSLASDAQHLKNVLAHYLNNHRDLPARVLMMIGPEGDFTPAELDVAKSHGCLPITLGRIILRVETAAIYCLSVLSYELL
jgi:16S rRNA (uracil1498-N3)-methyltransferase